MCAYVQNTAVAIDDNTHVYDNALHHVVPEEVIDRAPDKVTLFFFL
jgi:hypothetical protein